MRRARVCCATGEYKGCAQKESDLKCNKGALAGREDHVLSTGLVFAGGDGGGCAAREVGVIDCQKRRRVESLAVDVTVKSRIV